jgi:UDP-3-O-[3-hydroxymyristoyl] glucosamine N-acyltransferase
LAREETQWTLAELAQIVGGTLCGPEELVVCRPVPAGYEDPEGITFAENETYLERAERTSVAAVIIPHEMRPTEKPHIRHANPRQAFGRVLALSWRDLPLGEGVHPTALIAEDVRIAPTARVGAYAIIESGCILEDDVKVYPFCYVGPNCHLKAGAKLYPRVALYSSVRVGERTVIHSGAVIGADGFGYFWDGEKHRKVPQVGSVLIGDDCEIGALTAVDRATAGVTRIGDGTKVDNLVQIAHNVEIGDDVILAGQVGISGSTRIGDRCTLAGQVGIGDHVEIADDVLLGGQSGVEDDIPESGRYWGTPALPFAEAARLMLLLRKLPDLNRRLKELEARLAERDQDQT